MYLNSYNPIAMGSVPLCEKGSTDWKENLSKRVNIVKTMSVVYLDSDIRGIKERIPMLTIRNSLWP